MVLSRSWLGLVAIVAFVSAVFRPDGVAQEEAPGGSQELPGLVLVLKGAEGEALRLVAAVNVIRENGYLTLTDAEGRRTVVQEDAVLAQISLPPANFELVTVDNAKEMIAAFEQAEGLYPDLAQALAIHREGWSRVVRQWEEKAENQKKMMEDKLQAFLVETYDPTAIYTRSHVRDRLKVAAELKAALPERAAAVKEREALWKAEAERLEQGLVKIDGQWKSPAEVQAQSAAALAAAAALLAPAPAKREELRPLDPELVPAKEMKIAVAILAFSVVVLVLTLLTGIGRLFSQADFLGLAYLVFGLAGLIGYTVFGIMTQIRPADVPELVDNPEVIAAPVVELINSPVPKSGAKPVLTDTQIQAWLQQHVSLNGGENADSWSVRRKSVRFAIHRDSFSIYEEVEFLKRRMILAYRIRYRVQPNGIDFPAVEVSLGHTPVPGRVASWIWDRMLPSVRNIIAHSRLMETYQVETVEEGRITFRR
jgi:hypothetical protein